MGTQLTELHYGGNTNKTVALTNECSADDRNNETPEDGQHGNQSREPQNEDVIENGLLPPVSSSLATLLSGSRRELATEQVQDLAIQEIREHQRMSTPAKNNISFQLRSAVLYRIYKDKR